MRPFALLPLTVVLLTAPALCRADPPPPAEPGRIAGLIADLGDEEFATREAATAALERLGEAALPALRQAVADSDDLEIRRRAGAIVEQMDYRVVVHELDRLEGTWQGVSAQENGQAVSLDGDAPVRTVIHKGDAVSTNSAGAEVSHCTWRIVDAAATPARADLIAADGRVLRAVYRLDGDTLSVCGAYAEDDAGRPGDFSTHPGDGRYLTTLKKVR